MRKFLLILSMALCWAFVAMAVPAKPGWHTVTQSDGTTLKVQAVGNAFNHALLTTDGLSVAKDRDGDFYYVSARSGMTTVRAHDEGQRSAAEMAFINSQRDDLKMKVRQYQMQGKKDKFGVGGSNAESGVPAQGSRRIPIILVEFKDKKFNNTREDVIDAMLTGNESVGQYFRDQSNGLYQPEFDVYGIYELSRNREYYGGHSGSDNDKGLGWMVTEACQLAAADGVSFKPYDTNSDDYCDVVIVIYAGVGEAQASWNHPEAVWPCNWNLSSAAYYNQGGYGAFRPNNNDPLVDNFAVFNELHGSNDNGTVVDGIGTFAHEFGHCLGLPDLYDTGDDDHYGMGDWDIMCMGCYNNDGFTPPGYSAYEKVFMGWIEYTMPQPGTYYTLPVFNQKNAATDKALCIVSDINPNEFFVVENRRRQGWDRYAPGDGIMITHVTYSAERWWYNSVNNQNIQLVTLMNADNSWSYYDEDHDLWPYGNRNAFTDNSTPAARLNMAANGNITGNAGYLGKPLTEMVINADGTASFWYMKGAATGPVISVTKSELNYGDVMMNNSASMTFKVIGQSLTGDVTLTLNGGDGAFTVDPMVISAADAALGKYVTVTFAPDEIQDYDATVTLSSNGAEDVVVNLLGRGIIEHYEPVMQPADNAFINLTKFRADWTDMTPDDNIVSYTLEVSTKPTVELLETADFSTLPDVLDGDYLADISSDYDQYLPEGWYATSYLASYGGALVLAYNAIIRTPTYNLAGYDKVTVVVNAAPYGSASCSMRVYTSKDEQILTLGEDFADYVIVLDCAANDAVTIADLADFLYLKRVQVYAGDLTTQDIIKATESGDETYRLITDITDKFYTVKDLTAGGTFVYKVKTLYLDGTESGWSNRQEVTLFDNGHGYELGDVNHDEAVNISDVIDLINDILNGTSYVCPVCADINEDSEVNISDAIILISMILNSTK
ncbi:MAG: M6 family metalloprotease domain-containing protein [Muribaculaceae bacterium]|nr:M6 family metalloprotease domain-containing protein [Muribaculaceae bacterium]